MENTISQFGILFLKIWAIVFLGIIIIVEYRSYKILKDRFSYNNKIKTIINIVAGVSVLGVISGIYFIIKYLF
jgi:hypothetical protein